MHRYHEPGKRSGETPISHPFSLRQSSLLESAMVRNHFQAQLIIAAEPEFLLTLAGSACYAQRRSGRVAQWESTAFTRQGSEVQSLSRLPFIIQSNQDVKFSHFILIFSCADDLASFWRRFSRQP